MAYNKHETCMAALAEGNFLKGSDEDPLLSREIDLAALHAALLAEFVVVVNNDENEWPKVARTVTDLVSALCPGFYESVDVQPADRTKLELVGEVKAKDDAKTAMEKLFWTEASITATGPVQKLLGDLDPPALLVEVPIERYTQLPDGSTSPKKMKMKGRFITANADIINTHYVMSRGVRLFGIAKATSADVKMAITRIPLAAATFRATFGLQVDNAIEAVKPNASARLISKEVFLDISEAAAAEPTNGNTEAAPATGHQGSRAPRDVRDRSTARAGV